MEHQASNIKLKVSMRIIVTTARGIEPFSQTSPLSQPNKKMRRGLFLQWRKQQRPVESGDTFVRQSERSTRNHSSCGLSSSPYKFHHFQPLAPFPLYFCSPLLSAPSFTPWSPSFALNPLPFLFEPFRTVYKVALLNWKPQLCRCYCYPFSLPCSLLSSPFRHSPCFVFFSRSLS